MIAADCGDENIVESIIIVIADGDAHAVASDVKTGAFGCVGEMTMAIVMIKRRSGRRCAFGYVTWPIRRIDEKQILMAVVVVIQKGDAATHGLGQELFTVSPVDMSELDSGLTRDVGEL